MTTPIVYIDIAGPSVSVLQRFYSDVFGWDSMSPQFKVSIGSPVTVSIREDPPEKRVYLGVEDVAAKLTEIEIHGGSIDVGRFEVPGVVVLGLFRDPAGNPMGLVEMAGGEPVIP